MNLGSWLLVTAREAALPWQVEAPKTATFSVLTIWCKLLIFMGKNESSLSKKPRNSIIPFTMKTAICTFVLKGMYYGDLQGSKSTGIAHIEALQQSLQASITPLGGFAPSEV